MLEEGENFAYELGQIIKNFYEHRDELKSLGLHVKALATPDAAALIATTVLKECR